MEMRSRALGWVLIWELDLRVATEGLVIILHSYFWGGFGGIRGVWGSFGKGRRFSWNVLYSVHVRGCGGNLI